MRTNRKRVQLPFLFSASDGLGADGKVIARSYGNVIEGVFTRASKALQLTPTSTPYLATWAHSQPRHLGNSLLLERDATNYLLQSQTLNTTWSKTNVTVTSDATTAPDGTVTADKVEATASAATTFSQTEATISSTAVVYSIYGKRGSGDTACNSFVLRNATTATTLQSHAIDWSTGDLTNVTGTNARAEQLEGEWFRIILWATTGITAGDDITVYAGFSGDSETAGEYAYLWGAQLEAGTVVSSYIPTTTVAVARAADALYFPSGITTPAEHGLTLYARGYNYGSAGALTDRGVMSIGGDGNASFFIDGTTGGAFNAFHRVGSDVNAGASAAVAYGDFVELRAYLSPTGTVTLGQSINVATETVTGPGSALAITSSWNQARVYLGSRNGTPGQFAFLTAAIAYGPRTLAEMRDLAEVG